MRRADFSWYRIRGYLWKTFRDMRGQYMQKQDQDVDNGHVTIDLLMAEVKRVL